MRYFVIVVLFCLLMGATYGGQPAPAPQDSARVQKFEVIVWVSDAAGNRRNIDTLHVIGDSASVRKMFPPQILVHPTEGVSPSQKPVGVVPKR